MFHSHCLEWNFIFTNSVARGLQCTTATVTNFHSTHHSLQNYHSPITAFKDNITMHKWICHDWSVCSNSCWFWIPHVTQNVLHSGNRQTERPEAVSVLLGHKARQPWSPGKQMNTCSFLWAQDAVFWCTNKVLLKSPHSQRHRARRALPSKQHWNLSWCTVRLGRHALFIDC